MCFCNLFFLLLHGITECRRVASPFFSSRSFFPLFMFANEAVSYDIFLCK
ncbi:hypothetical protein ABFX02_05G070300 [Erythranthe guttata]